MQPHQDLGAAALEVSLKPYGVVAGVEDEQWRLAAAGVLSAEATHQCLDLLGGRIVGVLLGRNAPRVDRRDSGIALESELGH